MIVIVVGMHCSGASNVAALLHSHGVVMGEDELLLPTEIATGAARRFENARFRILNDRMAERQGYQIQSWNPDIPICRPGAITRLRMRHLIRNFELRYAFWGFKDPRSCLTLDAWLREIERVSAIAGTRIVYCVRDPDAVVRAMASRAALDRGTALRLWKVYNERAIAAIDAWRMPTHYVSYEDLSDDAERTTAALLRFVGVPAGNGDAARAGRAAGAGAPGDGLSDAVLEMKSRIMKRVRATRRGARRDAG